MGAGFSISETEYAKQFNGFRSTDLTVENSEELDKLL